MNQNTIIFQICNQRRECFDMKDRIDRTVIGTNKTGNGTPVKSYYTCHNGYCTEIYNLTCERKCNDTEFDLVGKNSVIFTGEKVITSKCFRTFASGDVSLPSLNSVNLIILHCQTFKKIHFILAKCNTFCQNYEAKNTNAELSGGKAMA